MWCNLNMWFFKYARGQTDRQTVYRNANGNTSHNYRREVKRKLENVTKNKAGLIMPTHILYLF